MISEIAFFIIIEIDNKIVSSLQNDRRLMTTGVFQSFVDRICRTTHVYRRISIIQQRGRRMASRRGVQQEFQEKQTI
uniref:Uncharacterized protein n=1 Tax=Romanomermis culicivorax TaxID=13658 RepID=A0A915KNU3_ROMCU